MKAQSPPTDAPSVDPLALLSAHQDARDQGVRIPSIIWGFRGVGRALWGQWLGHYSGAGQPWLSCAVAPSSEQTTVDHALRFIAPSPNAPLLFVPESSRFAETLATAYTLAQHTPQRPLAIVTDPPAVMDVLEHHPEDSDTHGALRLVLVGGLIVLDQHVESVLNRSVLRQDERPLYRSDHEQILHKLLHHDAQINADFKTNQRVKGASGKAYEVDLWCAELKLAIEVDGSQHVSQSKQRTKDGNRDEDLAAVGIKTLRIHATEIISDPSRVITFIRTQIETMT